MLGSKRLLFRLAGAGCISLALYQFWYFLVFVLMASDTGWLVRTGDFIVEHLSVPSHDLFSWTLSSKTYLCYQWLFEVLLSLLCRAGGLWLLGAAVALSSGLICFFILPRLWLKQGVPLNLIFLFLPLTMAPTLFYARPQSVSYLFFIAFISLLERWRRQDSSNAILLWLLPLSVLWANLHSFCITALLIVAAYAVDAAFCSRNRLRLLWICGVLALCSVSMFLNPYGIHLLSYISSFAGAGSFNIIGELMPLWESREWHLLPFFLYLVFLWIFIISERRSLPLAGLIISSVSAVLALFLVRFASVCVMTSWTFLGMALAGRFGGGAKQIPSKRNSLIHLLLVVSLTISAWFARVPDEQRAAVIFTNNDLRLYGFLDGNRQKPEERTFNDSPTGSYMIFFGLTPVFIDNRFDFYGREFCEKWLNCLDASPGWQDYLRNFKIERIVIRKERPLYLALMQSPGWQIMYADAQTSVWLSDSEAHRKRICSVLSLMRTEEKKGTLSAVREHHIALGRAFLSRGSYRSSIQEFRTALDSSPDDPELHHQIIHALALAGYRNELESELRQARRFFAGSAAADWPGRSAELLLEKYRHARLKKTQKSDSPD